MAETLESLKEENRRLSELLREAREVARTARDAPSLPYAQWSRDQHEADRVIARIDAVLSKQEKDVINSFRRSILFQDELKEAFRDGLSEDAATARANRYADETMKRYWP